MVMGRLTRFAVMLALSVLIVGWLRVPVPAAEEPSSPSSRSSRRYWLEQADRNRDRERQRAQETEDYRRQSEERQRRWDEWWRDRQQPTRTPPSED